MKNTIWLESAFDALKQEGIFEEESFEFGDISDTSRLTYGERNAIPLVKLEELERFCNLNRSPSIMAYHSFRRAFNYSFGNPEVTNYLDMAKLENHADYRDTILTYIPGNKHGNIAAKIAGSIFTSRTLVNTYDATVVNLSLGRNILTSPTGERKSFNSLGIILNSPVDEHLRTINLGEDFAVLSPFGYSFKKDREIDRSEELARLTKHSKEFGSISSDHEINSMNPSQAVHHYVKFFQQLSPRLGSLSKVRYSIKN